MSTSPDRIVDELKCYLLPPDNVTMATEVDDLDRVREWFGFDSMAVLSHSWGGLVAMEYAIRHPERVSHLILMNSAPASRADALAFRDELARRRSPEQTQRMNELRSDPRFRRKPSRMGCTTTPGRATITT